MDGQSCPSCNRLHTQCEDCSCVTLGTDCPSIASEPCDMDDFCCRFPRCCTGEEECSGNAWEAAFDLFDDSDDDSDDNDSDDDDHDHDDSEASTV